MTIVGWENLFFTTTFFLYLGSALFYILELFNIHGRSGLAASVLAYCGLTLHTVAIILRTLEAGRAPFSNQFEFASIFAWGIVIAYLVSERSTRFSYRSCGAFVMPFALIIIGYASLLPRDIRPLMPALQSGWLAIHVGTAIFAYGSFALACGLAIAYFVREQAERKHWGLILARIPALPLLDHLSHKAITFGFFMLSLVIITGAIWAEQAWGRFWGWDPKETWSLVTWFIYAVYLHTRFSRNWQGRKASWLAIIGFACVLFTYIGVNILLPGLHSYR